MAKTHKWSSDTAKSICEETGLADPVEGAIKLAEDLTLECSLVRPFENLPLLASYRDATIEEIEMEDAGRLIPLFKGNFNFLIQVNSTHNEPRKRFSTCHEIGHILMPNFLGASSPRRDRETMTWNEEAEEEFLCDVAAAELLMPRREFVPRLRGCEMRIEALTELAEEFGSSLEATALNIARANVEDIAVIIWEKGWNKSQKYAANTPSLFDDEDGFGPPPKSFRIKMISSCGLLRNFHFPHNKSIKENSLIYQAAETEFSVCGNQLLPVGGEAMQEFFTQSMSFPIWRDGAIERRVFTMVHLNKPNWDL